MIQIAALASGLGLTGEQLVEMFKALNLEE